MIEAITFDLWETLIQETSESARKVKEARIRNLYMLLQDQGYPGTCERVEAAYEEVGELTLHPLWDGVLAPGTSSWALEQSSCQGGLIRPNFPVFCPLEC